MHAKQIKNKNYQTKCRSVFRNSNDNFLAHLAKGNVNFCHHLASVVRRLSFVVR